MAVRIEKIALKKLFGKFDHVIPLNQEERITIIHGLNGVGKTTVLALLDAISKRKLLTIQKIPFREAKITFNDSATLTLKKSPSKEKGEFADVVASISRGGERGIDRSLPVKEMDPRVLARRLGMPTHAIEDMVPQLHQTDQYQWWDESTEDSLTLSEVLLRYGDQLPVSVPDIVSIPDEIEELLSTVNVYFIQTQRLLTDAPAVDEYRFRQTRRSRSPSRAVVHKLAQEMSSMIEDKLRESGTLSASLDRQFPSTLLSSSLPDTATEENIRDLYAQQTSERDRLMKAGLIAEETLVGLPPGKIAVSERKVLWFYLNDVRQKLQVFSDLLVRIELFKDIINSRFLAKSISVNKDHGLVCTGDTGNAIPLSALSSGEQHELVLAFELLFKVKPSSLILVDEPELSLHVTWQHKFLDDITRISELVDLDFLIATHSPSIIHGRDELMISLG